MTMQFTERDEGKPVVDINDTRVSTVVTVEDSTAYANFRVGVIATLESTFGLETTDRGLYLLQDETVDRVRDDKTGCMAIM